MVYKGFTNGYLMVKDDWIDGEWWWSWFMMVIECLMMITDRCLNDRKQLILTINSAELPLLCCFEPWIHISASALGSRNHSIGVEQELNDQLKYQPPHPLKHQNQQKCGRLNLSNHAIWLPHAEWKGWTPRKVGRIKFPRTPPWHPSICGGAPIKPPLSGVTGCKSECQLFDEPFLAASWNTKS